METRKAPPATIPQSGRCGLTWGISPSSVHFDDHILTECADEPSMALRNIRPQAEVPDQVQDASVRAYIDDTLTGLLRELTLPPSEGQPSITLRSRPDASSCIVNPVNGALETVHSSTSYRTYTWPGNTAYESWKFSTHIL